MIFLIFGFFFLAELRSTQNCAATTGYEDVQEEKHIGKLIGKR